MLPYVTKLEPFVAHLTNGHREADREVAPIWLHFPPFKFCGVATSTLLWSED